MRHWWRIFTLERAYNAYAVVGTIYLHENPVTHTHTSTTHATTMHAHKETHNLTPSSYTQRSQHTPWGPSPLVTALNNSNYIKFQEYLFQFSNFLTSSSILAFKWERREGGERNKRRRVCHLCVCKCKCIITFNILFFHKPSVPNGNYVCL